MLTRSFYGQFLILIMAILLALLPNCDATNDIKKFELQAGDGVMVAAETDVNKAEEMLIFPPSAEITKGKLGGRKMMSEGRREERQEILKGDGSKKAEISGASSVGKLNMQSSNSKLNDGGGKVNMGGFMALNADYHMARAHPPRHN